VGHVTSEAEQLAHQVAQLAAAIKELCSYSAELDSQADQIHRVADAGVTRVGELQNTVGRLIGGGDGALQLCGTGEDIKGKLHSYHQTAEAIKDIALEYELMVQHWQEQCSSMAHAIMRGPS
jgi:uncharacterized protein YoxC